MKSLLKRKVHNQFIFHQLIKKTMIILFKNIMEKSIISYPNQISFLSYDLVGLIYYLLYKNDFIVDEKIFFKKNKFKGKIGIFEINQK